VLQEENYITCILEDEPSSGAGSAGAGLSARGLSVIELPAPSTAPSPSPAKPLSPETVSAEEALAGDRQSSGYDRKGGRTNPASWPPNAAQEGEQVRNGFDCSIKQERNKSSDDEMVAVEEFKVKMEPIDTRQPSPNPQRSPSPKERVPIELKEELNGSSDVLTGNNNQKTEPQYCKSCHLSFNYYSTFIQHKKMHCGKPEGASGSHAEPVRTRTEASAL